MSSAEIPRFQLTARDTEVVQAIYTYRAMTTPQLDALFFTPDREWLDGGRVSSRCLHRLKLLFHAGYVRRVEQAQTLSDGRKPLVYFLDRGGAHYLANRTGCEITDLDWDRQGHIVGSLFLDHLLLSNDVRVAITLAAQRHAYGLHDWRDERELRRVHYDEAIVLKEDDGNERSVTLIPDGYFMLETDKSRYHQFLEIDRATATLQVGRPGKRDWGRKVAAYLAYFRSGAYQQRYQTQSLRIMTITTSEKRLAHLKKVTEEVGGKSRFWFTTADKITPANILTAPIWQVASRDDLHSFVW